MSKAFVSRGRSAVVAIFVMAAFCVLLGRLYYLHIWNHQSLAEHAAENRRMVTLVEAQRGNITDIRGNLLATTQTTYNIGVDPCSFKEKDWKKVAQLADILELDVKTLERKIATKSRRGSTQSRPRQIRWSVLKKDVDAATYEAVKALNISSVYGNQSHRRAYPGGKLASHLLGFVNKEEVAVTGVERVFDFYLRPQHGWRETERDGRRSEVAHLREREVNSTDGLNVELTLDLMIQHVVEAEVERLAEIYQPKGISILVSEPATGALLALANYPNYDPNEFYDTVKYPMDTQRNRAITDVFEPGSTFKIVPAAGALNERLVDPFDRFRTDQSRVEYKGRTLRLPADHRTYEELSVREIVVKSSNRGAAHLGLALGGERLYEYAEKFGFGELTGSQLGGEVSGVLHATKNWDGATITRLPMGHAISATPMQVHYAMATIANNGVLMKPMIARRVFDQTGSDITYFSPTAKHRVVSNDVAAVVSEMLAEVVGENGTARRAAIDDYQVAGKTGTTQKIVAGRYSSEHHVASFSGFFPADSPELVITVIVDEPQLDGTGYGGVVAAPAFKNIAEACIRYLGIRPSTPASSFVQSTP